MKKILTTRFLLFGLLAAFAFTSLHACAKRTDKTVKKLNKMG
ncbi:MAG: hypothetical protein AB1458_05825 [Bacteroidota bacterium]